MGVYAAMPVAWGIFLMRLPGLPLARGIFPLVALLGFPSLVIVEQLCRFAANSKTILFWEMKRFVGSR